MSVVKINAVTVPEGMGEEFIERFAKRAGSVENQEGFEEFLLLKPTDSNPQYFVFTRWASEEAFEAWLSSSDFAAAHAHVTGAGTSGGHGTGHSTPENHGAAHGHGGSDSHAAAEGHGGGHGAGPVAAAAELLAFEVIERVAQ